MRRALEPPPKERTSASLFGGTECSSYGRQFDLAGYEPWDPIVSTEVLKAARSAGWVLANEGSISRCAPDGSRTRNGCAGDGSGGWMGSGSGARRTGGGRRRGTSRDRPKARRPPAPHSIEAGDPGVENIMAPRQTMDEAEPMVRRSRPDECMADL
ncbi:Hypothetical protein MexAM1_META2p0671 (plasmid) [Methylorubrum extorquens AM1]|uniref:Uncharacterized protein n=1 Tax=Methylorubrum extorquens (strain ATCC 14718 / DSM 1338 / JCM 2805 / NCIMB 9133 / AM1) TaxID=272630 RepID=C5B4Y6_METEA|nr:Hypothetical protein MexAM1_META2p0671 [Methylorubrum extorquens AM1]